MNQRISGMLVTKQHKREPQFCSVTVGSDQLPVDAVCRVLWAWETLLTRVTRLYTPGDLQTPHTPIAFPVPLPSK
jgi:hypothetical protein